MHKEEFIAAFWQHLLLIVTPDQPLLVDHAGTAIFPDDSDVEEVAELYWVNPVERDKGPEACAETAVAQHLGEE